MITKKQDAFSLMEIMIAIAIIGVMMAVAGPALYTYLKRAKVTGTKTSMEGIKSALQLYREDMGKFPTSREGLEVLFEAPSTNRGEWHGPYLSGNKEKALSDGWKNEFEYNCPPIKYKNLYKQFEIISTGGGDSEEAEMHTGM